MSVISIPAWLLRTFGSGPTVDALLGDLHEEYQQRHSAAWFWRQALTGVAVTFAADVRAHKLVTLRSIALAWGMKIAAGAGFFILKPWISGAFASGERDMFTVAASRMVDGVRMPRVLEVPSSFIVYDPLILLFLTIVAAWISGRLVSRLHRASSTSSLLAIAITFAVIGGWPSFSVLDPAGEALILEGAWLTTLQSLAIVLPVVVLMAGGLRGARSEQHTLARD